MDGRWAEAAPEEHVVPFPCGRTPTVWVPVCRREELWTPPSGGPFWGAAAVVAGRESALAVEL